MCLWTLTFTRASQFPSPISGPGWLEGAGVGRVASPGQSGPGSPLAECRGVQSAVNVFQGSSFPLPLPEAGGFFSSIYCDNLVEALEAENRWNTSVAGSLRLGLPGVSVPSSVAVRFSHPGAGSRGDETALEGRTPCAHWSVPSRLGAVVCPASSPLTDPQSC